MTFVSFCPQVCQGQRDGRRLGDPNNCRGFIECQGGSRIERTCDNGQLFETSQESCMSAHLVRCGTRLLPPADMLPQSPEDFFPPCPSNGVSFRSHPHDCQAYFICAHGHLIQHSCAADIYFNPDTLQCDFARNVQCRLMRIPIPQTPLLPDCSAPGPNYFPNLVDCKQYYVCINEQPKLMDCPSGHLWDNKNLKCERSESDICARSFDAAKGTFKYGLPRADEKRALKRTWVKTMSISLFPPNIYKRD